MRCGDPVEVEMDKLQEVLTEEEKEELENSGYIKMDYSLENPSDRVEKVKKIINNTPSGKLTSTYLEKLADYIIFAMDKKERQEKRILTDNHMVTVNDRETSFEGLVGKLENGEDGLYNMITEDKNVIFKHKAPITQHDIDTIPGLKELRESIEQVEKEFSNARGKRAYLLKKQIIEMRKDQYELRNTFKKPIYCTNLIKSLPKMNIVDHITINEDGSVSNDSLISFFDEKHVSSILCNYAKLKMDSWEAMGSDSRWMMLDFENLADRALKEKYPMYYKLMIYKIDGKQNIEIQSLLEEEFGIKHSVEYISSLWRKKIPKIIVEQATNDYLEWHYTFEEKGKWKRCSRCGQIKLAHNNYFSKNKTSKDGFYSICKGCRNKK